MTVPVANATPRLPLEPPITMLDDTTEPAPHARVAVPSAANAAAPNPNSNAHRGGMVRLRCELKTPRVRQFYRRDFDTVSRMLHGLHHARDFRGVDGGQVDTLEASIAASMDTARLLFAASTVRLHQQLVQHQLADIPIHYADPMAVWASIVSARAREYLEMLVDADDAFACVERAWLLGLLDTRERRLQEAGFRRAIRTVGSTVRQAYSQMARQLRTM